MSYQTSKCSQFHHPEICFDCDSTIPKQDIDWLIALLEGQVAEGIQYKAGQTFAIGWMLTTFETHTNGQLKLAEPDMASMPIKYVPQITQTLKQLRNQNDICASCELTPKFSSLRESIAVPNGYVDCHNLFLARSEPEGHFSGWIFHDITQGLSQDTSNHYLVSLYEFACQRPDLIKYLALPINAAVHIKEQDSIRIIANQQELPIKSDSYLALLNQQR